MKELGAAWVFSFCGFQSLLLLLILLCAGIGGGFYWAKKQVDRSPVKVMPHRKPPAGQDEIEDEALTNVPP